MYPYLLPQVFGYLVPMYDLLIVIGCFFMLLYVGSKLESRLNYTRQQANKILIIILVCLFLALGFSYAFDTVFHTIKNGEFTHGSITFLGGLIGGVGSFIGLFHFFLKEHKQDFKEIINIILTGVILAHAFGRIGCYMAGCCFGIPTDSFLGVIFPHGHAHDHYPDIAIFPTQLFESAFLFILFGVFNKVQFIKGKEAEMYLISYGVWRFFLEIIRGDDRGAVFTLIETQYNTYPTPSQLLSLGLLIAGIILYKRFRKQEAHS